MCQLKRALGNHQQVHQLVPFINEKHEWLTLPEEIYGYRKNLATKGWEVLINWKGLPPHEATWEDCNDFRQQFPDFHLEDKVDLEEESDARPPILFKYSRKNNINRNINPCKNIGEIIGGENIEEDLSQSSVSKTD